jgi:hypothetical protein
MTHPRQPSTFHHESWSTPWRSSSSEFPPEETYSQRITRQKEIPEWKSTPGFLKSQCLRQLYGWPWGWVIYRTTYATTSDEDWARAIEKLDQACLAGLADKEGEWTWLGRTLIELVREGYRNVIFEDPTLEGASEAVIRSRHRAWAKTYGRPAFGACLRFHYPLLLDDRCVRSILASAEPRVPDLAQYELGSPFIMYEPGAMVGYVNVVDAGFIGPGSEDESLSEDEPESEDESESEDEPESEDENHYRGMVRVHLDCLFNFADSCEYMEDKKFEWGDWGMETPFSESPTQGYVSFFPGSGREKNNKYH